MKERKKLLYLRAEHGIDNTQDWSDDQDAEPQSDEDMGDANDVDYQALNDEERAKKGYDIADDE